MDNNDKRQQQLEAYKDLSRWNLQDVMVTLSWDRIFLPIVAVGWATAFAKYPDRPEVFGAAFVTGLVVLWFWKHHCERHREWMKFRFHIIKTIENNMGIVGHKDVQEPTSSSNMRVRRRVVIAFAIIGGIILVWLIVKKVCCL